LHAHNPLLRCGVALAGANTLIARPNQIADDGLFTGLEAAQLDLHGTELVILSACESSVGEIHAGEGAMSLRRAFRIAGAQAVLASQWPVSSAATQSLMKNFIAHWQIRCAAPSASCAKAKITPVPTFGLPLPSPANGANF
jgi:CHAT domain-containing protein